MANNTISPWKVDQWPTEATAEDVEEARRALSDGDGPVTPLVLATIIGVSESSAWRYLRRGCSGPAAVVIHGIRWLYEQDVRTGGC